MTHALTDEELADPRAVAYYAPIDVTPELASKWDAWKNDYVVSCMTRWIDQGATSDEALDAGAVVLLELNDVDGVPWMPMGEALGVKLEATLMPGKQPWEGQKRIDFMSACRTLDLCDENTQALAAAFQIGISLEQLQAKYKRLARQSPTNRCALYRHFDKKGLLLYVGISDNPVGRKAQHKTTSPWYRFVDEITVEWFETRDAADKAERAAIRDERPAFNTTHNARNRKAALDYLFAALEESHA